MIDERPGPGPLAWAAFAASMIYAGIYFESMGLGILLFAALVAAVSLFSRQRTGLFPFLLTSMLILLSAGGFETRVARESVRRSLAGVDFVAMFFLIAAIALTCEEGLRRFGHRIDSPRPFHVSMPERDSGKMAYFRSVAILLSIALLGSMVLALAAVEIGSGSGLDVDPSYVRLGIYVWALGTAVFAARTVRAFASLRTCGKVRARMTLLELSWRSLQGPLRLFLRLRGVKRYE
jgi:hypothetical protein